MTINITYDASIPSNPEQRPAQDPTGTRLLAIAQAAADYWEDVFRDDVTYDISVSWESNITNLATAFGTTTRHISFNGNDAMFDFFIDDGDVGPIDDSEYQLGFNQRAIAEELYGDLTAMEQANWYRGAPPAQLEVTYSANRNGSNPATLNAFDLYTTALHEIAHHLSNYGNSTTADGFWDFAPSQIGGLNVGLAVAPPSNGSHTAPPSTLMFPSGAPEERKLPSVSDILAIASATGLNEIDLPRKDFLAGSDWHTPGAWIGNRVPDADDDVHLRASGSLLSVGMSADAYASNLLVSERAFLSTDGLDLFVGPFSGGTTIIDGVGEDTTLFITGGSTLRTGNLLVENGGSVNLQDGFVLVYDEQMRIGSNGSSLIGFGNVRLLDDAVLVSTGLIASRGGGVLRLDADSGQSWSFGSTASTLEALTGDIVVGSGSRAREVDHRGQMLIGSGHHIDFQIPWTTHASTQLTGGVDGPATLRGGTSLSILGDVTVTNGVGVIEADEVSLGKFFSPRTIDVPADSELQVKGDMFLVGIAIEGDGTFSPDGDLEISDNVTIGVDTFDWDGFGGNNTRIFGSLEITSRIVGSSPSDAYSGTITVDGTLVVDTELPWALDSTGELILETRFVAGASVSGTGLINYGRIAGEGLIDVNTIINNGVIDSSTLLGELAINAPTFDLDGESVDGDQQGELRVSQSGRLLIETNFANPTSFSGTLGIGNGGDFEMLHGGLILTGGGDRGQLTTNGGTLVMPRFVHRGDLTIGNFGFTIDADAVLGAGGVTSTGSVLPGTLRIVRDVTLEEGHTMIGGGRVVVQASGRLGGTGTISWELTVDGTLAPGPLSGASAVGQIKIDADALLAEGSTFEVSLGGAGTGQYDQLVGASTVQLGGNLVVLLAEVGTTTFTPSAGSMFELISATTLVGEFARWQLPGLPLGLEWMADRQADAFSLLVVTGLAGDYNDDGVVDAADYTVWRDTLGSTGVGLLADGNYDGLIDVADYEVWKINFGSSLATLSLSAVPEPSSAWATVALVLAALTQARGRGTLAV